MDKQESRRRVIRELWRWGATMEDCKRMGEEIDRLLGQIDDATNVIGAQKITGAPAGGSSTSDPTLRAVQMRDNAQRKIDALLGRINAVMERKDQLDECIQQLDDRQQRLIEMRYARGMSISTDIPNAMHADRKTVYRWHAQAVDKLWIKMPHNAP